MKKKAYILMIAALMLLMAACGGGDSGTTESSDATTPASDPSQAATQPTAGFSQQEIDEIDALLQGTWTVSTEDAEPVYVFSDGRVTVEAVVWGADGGVNSGTYEIGTDSLGNGLLSFAFDNGVNGSLMFTYKEKDLSLIFSVGEKLYMMGKTSDSVEVSNLGSFWDYQYFVDDFNQPTEEAFIANKRTLNGTFSNSATTDSKVSVLFMVYEFDAELELAMVLNEYGNNPVVNSSQRNVVEYNILMKAGDGSTHEISGTMYEGGDRIFIDWDYRQTVIDALSAGGDVAFRVIQSDRTTTSYLFTVEASNFATLYQELFGS